MPTSDIFQASKREHSFGSRSHSGTAAQQIPAQEQLQRQIRFFKTKRNTESNTRVCVLRFSGVTTRYKTPAWDLSFSSLGNVTYVVRSCMLCSLCLRVWISIFKTVYIVIILMITSSFLIKKKKTQRTMKNKAHG